MLPTAYPAGAMGEPMARVRIREIAESKGLDVAKLSRRADLAYGTVWQLWNDPDRDVSFKTLGKIADALGVRITDLIEEDEPEPAVVR
jgi:DNA-binding Xre family transcriptional regulator